MEKSLLPTMSDNAYSSFDENIAHTSRPLSASVLEKCDSNSDFRPSEMNLSYQNPVSPNTTFHPKFHTTTTRRKNDSSFKFDDDRRRQRLRAEINDILTPNTDNVQLVIFADIQRQYTLFLRMYECRTKQ